MAKKKFFSTSEDIAELAQNIFEQTRLPQIGVNLNVVSVTKAKEVLSIAKESAKMEFMTSTNDLCTLIIYEEAFDRLNDAGKVKLMEGVLSNVSYDTEKGKLNVDTSRYGELMRMRHKYADYVDVVEASLIAIEQIAEEEKQKKEAGEAEAEEE